MPICVRDQDGGSYGDCGSSNSGGSGSSVNSSSGSGGGLGGEINTNGGRGGGGPNYNFLNDANHVPFANDVYNIMSNQPDLTKIDTSKIESAADKFISQINNTSTDSTKSHLSAFQQAILVGLGIALVPEVVVAGGSAMLTALTIGPVAEGMTLELLANPAFMQASTRAGAILGAGKLLNIYGVFKNTRLEKNIVSVETAAQHPLAGMTIEQVVQKATELGLETPRDQLLLWSGLGEGLGVKLSKEFAEKNGGITIEMTPGGAWLDGMNLFGANSPFSKKEVIDIWRDVSSILAQKASGQVRAVIGNVNPESIYYKERSELLANENVLGVDELTIVPRVIFK